MDRNVEDRSGLDFSSHMYFRSNLSHVFVDIDLEIVFKSTF